MNQATTTKARAIQLIRTDDATPGLVKFFDRREADVKKAFIGQVDVTKLSQEALYRAARHGLTQNLLDSSNKLEGDARRDFIAKACVTVQNGGWSSAPVDEAKQVENAISALTKLGFSAEVAAQMIAKKPS